MLSSDSLRTLTLLSLRSFMGGLVSTAGAFFTFYIIVVAGFLALAGFFRLLGTFCSSFDVAARLASVLITLMILYSGERQYHCSNERSSLTLLLQVTSSLFSHKSAGFSGELRSSLLPHTVSLMYDTSCRIYYMNPLNYAFSAAMMNEFGKIDLSCDGTVRRLASPEGRSRHSSLI